MNSVEKLKLVMELLEKARKDLKNTLHAPDKRETKGHAQIAYARVAEAILAVEGKHPRLGKGS